MGTGNVSGNVVGTTKSIRDKINEVASSLSKIASNATSGLRAAFAKLEAQGDKIIAHLPGRSNKEVPNKSINKILADGVKVSDLFRVASGIALSVLTGNPIPLMLAQRHINNLQERIKAKEREVKKQASENRKRNTRASRVRLNKNDVEYRQLRALEKRMTALDKEAKLNIKRAEKQASREINDIDKNIINTTRKSFVRLGFSASDARQAARLALSKTNSRDINTVLKLALKEVTALQDRK